MIHLRLYTSPKIDQSTLFFQQLKAKQWQPHFYYVVVYDKSLFQCECINDREMKRLEKLSIDVMIVGVLLNRMEFRDFCLWIGKKIYVDKKSTSIKNYYLEGDIELND